jgi:hypothetical protein
MPRRKEYFVGEQVLLYGEIDTSIGRVFQWISGEIVFTDYLMVKVQCERPVYDTAGGYRLDGQLWCAHGSKKLRRKDISDEYK